MTDQTNPEPDAPTTDLLTKWRQWVDRYEQVDDPDEAEQIIDDLTTSIQANIPAPPKSLPEELRKAASGLPVTSKLKHQLVSLADRAEAVENALNEAYADRDAAYHRTQTLLGERAEDLNEMIEKEKLKAERYEWPKKTPGGHKYEKPTTYSELCSLHTNAAQATAEGWDADECPPEPTWDMVGLALAEAANLRYEVNNLIRGRDSSRAELDEAYDEMKTMVPASEKNKMRAERDDARKQSDRLSIHADNQRQELARLNAEVKETRTSLRRWCTTATNLSRERDRYRDEVKRLEGTVAPQENVDPDLPRPADVPDGEAWVVEVNGERRVGIRSESAEIGYGTPWATSPAPKNQWWVSDGEVTLVARLVPDVRRVIDRPEALDALPVGIVVVSQYGKGWVKTLNGGWTLSGTPVTSKDVIDTLGPVTVIHEGGTA